MRKSVSSPICTIGAATLAVFGIASSSRAQQTVAAPSPQWFTTVEVGRPESNTLFSEALYWPDYDTRKPKGISGRVGIGQKNTSIGPFDYWGIFGRSSQTRSNITEFFDKPGSRVGNYLGTYAWNGITRRTVLDFEAGGTLVRGNNLVTASKSADASYIRAIVGIRASKFDQATHYDYSSLGPYFLTGAPISYTAGHTFRFSGVGPRIGLQTRIGLTDTIAIVSEGSVAAVYGKQDLKYQDGVIRPGTPGGPFFPLEAGPELNGWVRNIEFSAAIQLTPWGADGASISVGVRNDVWARQRNTEFWSGPVNVAGSTITFATPAFHTMARTFEPFLAVNLPLSMPTQRE